jgi:cytochrome c oxidase subunit 4
MSDEHAGQHHVNYAIIFGILCFCTLMSVVFDVVKIENKIVLIILVMGVAVAKAMFVLTYFMHLKFEGNWKFVLLAPTCALAMGLPLALLPDVGVHYYTQDVPQMYDAVSAHDAATAHGEETDEKPKTPKKTH